MLLIDEIEVQHVLSLVLFLVHCLICEPVESVSVIKTGTFGKPVRPASSAADAHSGSQA